MFKGAGLLFFKTINNQKLILLGKRAINPHKNFWSVPGGKMSSRDEGDFWKCALRETKEEFFDHNFLTFDKTISNLIPLKKSRIVIPNIFEYWTFLIDITDLDIVFKPNWEFIEIKWFELDDLPEKTHLGVKYSLFKFKFSASLFSLFFN